MTRDSSPLHEQTSLQLLSLAIQEQETNVGELSNLYKEAAKSSQSSQSGNPISDELREKLNDMRETVVNGENSIENELKSPVEQRTVHKKKKAGAAAAPAAAAPV